MKVKKPSISEPPVAGRSLAASQGVSARAAIIQAPIPKQYYSKRRKGIRIYFLAVRPIPIANLKVEATQKFAAILFLSSDSHCKLIFKGREKGIQTGCPPPLLPNPPTPYPPLLPPIQIPTQYLVGRGQHKKTGCIAPKSLRRGNDKEVREQPENT